MAWHGAALAFVSSCMRERAPTCFCRPLEHRDLDGLEYTAAVCSEALRLFPPAVMSRRVAPHATQVCAP